MRFLLYEPGESLLHRMDSVSKFVWLLAVTALVVITASPIENGLAFVIVLGSGILLGRLPLGRLLKRLAYVSILGVWLTVFMAIVFPEGETTLATVGPFVLTWEGFWFGVGLGFRLLTLSAASLIFALTTNPRRMINELIVLVHLPYRLAYAAYAALRFLPLLQVEAQTILHAHTVRGGVGPVGRFGRLRLIRRLTVPLLAGAIRRVQLTAVAMDSRGFGAHRERTNIDPIERPASGLVFAGLFLAALVAKIVWQFVLAGGGLPQAPIFTGS